MIPDEFVKMAQTYRVLSELEPAAASQAASHRRRSAISERADHFPRRGQIGLSSSDRFRRGGP